MKRTFRYVMAAMFAALTFVATYFIQIPLANGYANLGDAVILICAVLFPSFTNLLAAGAGAAVADLASGFGIYAPATFLIKCGVFLIAMVLSRKNRLLSVLGCVLAELWMVLGYFLFEYFVAGLSTGALASVPGNLLQGLVSVLAALILIPVMLRSEEIRRRADLYRGNHL